jgi:hypothetical protein
VWLNGTAVIDILDGLGALPHAVSISSFVATRKEDSRMVILLGDSGVALTPANAKAGWIISANKTVTSQILTSWSASSACQQQTGAVPNNFVQGFGFCPNATDSIMPSYSYNASYSIGDQSPSLFRVDVPTFFAASVLPAQAAAGVPSGPVTPPALLWIMSAVPWQLSAGPTAQDLLHFFPTFQAGKSAPGSYFSPDPSKKCPPIPGNPPP